MNIQNVPSSGTTAPGAAGTKAAGNADNGFAGALVQAIGGGASETPAGSNGLMSSLGLGNLFGLAGQEDQGDAAASGMDDLLALLANLVNQLGNVSKDEEVPTDVQDLMASLLTQFQQILGQVSPSGTSEESSNIGADNEETLSSGTEKQPGLNDLPAKLRQTLAGIANALQSSSLPKETVAVFNQQLSTLQTLIQPEVVNASTPSSALNASATVTDTVTQQPVVVAVIQTDAGKRTVTTFKEPVMHWQLHVEQQSATENRTDIVNMVSDTASTGSDAPQTLWTMLAGDTSASTDASASAKATLPAQVPVAQFADQMEKFVVKQFALTNGNGITEARLNLHPEHLGQVQIHIVMQNGQMSAQFIAHSEAARELLENQMSQLRNSLQGQGIQVDRVDVVHQSNVSDGTSFLQQERRQSQSGARGESRKQGDGGIEDISAFEEELERSASLKDAGYGNSLNVTA